MSDKRDKFVPPSINMRGHGGAPGRIQQVVKPKNLWGTLKRLLKYLYHEKMHLLLVLVFVFFGAGMALAGPALVGRGIDELAALRGGEPGLMWLTVILLALAYLFDAISSFVQGFLMAGISQRTVRTLRSALFDHFQKLPIAFFDVHTHGDLMSRLTNDIDNISTTISMSVAQLMSLTVTLTGSLIIMLTLSPLLTVGLIVPASLAMLLTRTITKKSRPLLLKQQVILGSLSAQLEESVSGLLVVHGYNHEQAVIDTFSDLNNQYYDASLKALIWSGFLMPMMNVINNLSMILISAFGSTLALRGLVTVGTIGTFILYSKQFIRPLNELANVYSTLQTAVAGAERVFEIFDEAEEVPDVAEAVELRGVKGDVTFENVRFGYRPDVDVLSDINFHVPRGSSVALVGPTGAGKTTIVNLLARFYDISSGSIMIDGTDIRDFTRASLRQAFGIVLQETYLFTGSIRENIRYGNPDAPDDAVERAACQSGADKFIRRLPEGYDTLLTESGSNLSEGQRQLLAIARAILADAPILILDEATSSVDTRTELNIQRALLRLMDGRTTFIIAHRLSTIAGADRILVIDGGHIVEHGNHIQLLAQHGVYWAMWNSQLNNDAS